MIHTLNKVQRQNITVSTLGLPVSQVLMALSFYKQKPDTYKVGWKHLSQPLVSLTAPSSESGAEPLSYELTAPPSFVVEARANPITMIRKSGNSK